VAPTATIATTVFSNDTGTAGDFNTATAAQTISGTLSANMVAGEVVEVSTNNGTSWTTATTSVGANTWSLAGVTLTGSDTLKVRVTDTAGNSGTVHSQAYVLDTVAPTATIATTVFSNDTGTAGDFNTATAAQTISGTLSANMVAGEVVEVSTNNGTSWTTATTSVGANTWSLAGVTLTASDTLKVRVTDTAGNSGTVHSQAYVLDTTAPAMGTISFNAAENGTAVATLTATDANALTWSTTLTGADAALFSLTSGGVLTFNAAKNFEAPDDNGANHVYDLGVQVSDTAGNTTTQAITVNLTNVNEAPTVTAPTADGSTAVGVSMSTINAAAAFTDPDIGNPAFNTLTYSLSGGPAGVSINAATGVISGTPGVAGHYDLTVTASDSANSVNDQFSLDVVNPPALAASQALDNVSSLDVTSALVIAFNQAVTLNSTGTQHIKIFDDMGTAGWTVTNTTSGESKQDTFDNDVDITMTNGVASAVTIGGVDYTSRFDLANSVKVVGNNLVINLLQATGSHASTAGATDSTPFDWDFGANYHANLDAGVVRANGLGNAALTDATTLNFTTVAPVSAAAGVASQQMDLTGASAGLSAGHIWHNAHVQDATSSGLALDFSTGSHALYIQSDGGNTKTSTMTGRVLISGMGTDDVLYNDNSGNMALTSTEGLQTAIYGGSIATNTLLREVNNSDGGTNQQVVFSDIGTAHPTWTNVTSLNGGDNKLEDSLHFNSNVVIFG
jgi:hypothetical protein